MVRLLFLFIGLVVVFAPAPSWGLMVGGAGIQAPGDAEGYLADGSGGVPLLPQGTLSGGATTFVTPGPTPTPVPGMTPIPPTPPTGGPVVPEPGTVLLVGLGLLGIAGALRRRQAA